MIHQNRNISRVLNICVVSKRIGSGKEQTTQNNVNQDYAIKNKNIPFHAIIIFNPTSFYYNIYKEKIKNTFNYEKIRILIKKNIISTDFALFF